MKSSGTVITGLVVSFAGAIGITYAFVYSSLFQPVNAQVEENTTDISSLKQAECYTNANMRNVAAAVKATFVGDPNCNN